MRLSCLLEAVVLCLHCLQLETNRSRRRHPMQLADCEKLLLLGRYLCLTLTLLFRHLGHVTCYHNFTQFRANAGSSLRKKAYCHSCYTHLQTTQNYIWNMRIHEPPSAVQIGLQRRRTPPSLAQAQHEPAGHEGHTSEQWHSSGLHFGESRGEPSPLGSGRFPLQIG